MMMNAAVSPESKDSNPYNLPTGEELMNRPIDDPSLSGYTFSCFHLL